MIWTAVEKQWDQETQKHAGGKAREDVNRILRETGCHELTVTAAQKERETASPLRKILYHWTVRNIWETATKELGANDVLILQFPVVNHTLFFHHILENLKKRKVKVIALLHDLDLIRMSNAPELPKQERWRIRKEEQDVLSLFDMLIIHNVRMKTFLHDFFGIPNEKMVELGIFDYLIPEENRPDDKSDAFRKSCVIAGNLNRNKSEYVYHLPSAPDFELYGVNFEGANSPNVHYHGAYPADELPRHLKGGFGLVWDGNSPDTCGGVWGKYLAYNNPHKTSLYLACGLPVIIWENAALADFITENRLGLMVRSLSDLQETISALMPEEYLALKQNAANMAEKLTSGFYTKKAVSKAIAFVSKGDVQR